MPLNGQMSLLLSKSSMGQLMISGSISSLSCMLMTGLRNLEIRLVKEYWGTILLIAGLTLMMSKSTSLVAGKMSLTIILI